MLQTRPLVDCPEFSIVRGLGYREFRVANKRHASLTSVRSLALDPLGLSVLLLAIAQTKYPKVFMLTAVFCAFVLWGKFRQILHESVIVTPHGVQLETHRGFRSWTFISRRFVHRHFLGSIFIHEGFKTWNVRYYLALVKVGGGGGEESQRSIDVAFENLLPNVAVLREVYLGTKQLLEHPDRI